MATKPQALGRCTYCQMLGPLTDDHVPPRLLFPKPWPSNLITVPACFRCNNGAGRDDEYFRLHVAMRERANEYERTDWDSIRAAEQRNLQRGEAAGLRRLFEQSMERGRMRTGHPRACTLDTVRIARVASRIAKGLYFHHVRKAIPRDYMAVALMDARLAAFRMEDQEIAQRAAALLRTATIRIGTMFEYSYRLFDNEPYGSLWAFRFYEDTSFLVMTRNPGWFAHSLRSGSFPPPKSGYSRSTPVRRRPLPRPKV